ncbi:hypothetical protein [Nostoc sp. 2RC]|nr:hypothetical protein [Nostoc sp. 2RC]
MSKKTQKTTPDVWERSPSQVDALLNCITQLVRKTRGHTRYKDAI